MICIGCDMGLVKSGIVLLDQDFGILSQNLIRVSTKSAQRLVDIEKGFEFITRPYDEKDITIFVEGYAYGAKHQRESLAELGGVMRRHFCIKKLNYWVIPPNTLKLFVTGNGRASKNFMKKCTKDRWNISFKSDDECDAYGLARLGITVLRTLAGEKLELHPYEKEVVSNITTYKEYYLNANTAKRKGKK